MNEEEIKQDRIEAAKKFAKGLDELFKEFYKEHKPPYFIMVSQRADEDNKGAIMVNNGLCSVRLWEVPNSYIPLAE